MNRTSGLKVRRRRAITADAALRLAQYFETTERFWLNLQTRYDLEVDLLGASETDEKVEVIRRALPRMQPVRDILVGQNDEGYWGTAKDIQTWWPKKDTTFWVLGVLADFGMHRNTRRIASACEYVFRTQHPTGGFGWGSPPTSAECFTGILVEALAKLGYGDDPRLERAYGWFMSRQRHDGGFWCKDTGQPGMPRECEPSCARYARIQSGTGLAVNRSA